MADKVAMPYGVSVTGDGVTRNAKFLTDSANKNGNRDQLKLPGGPVRVTASWSGPEAVRLTLAMVGYPIELPAGGGFRSKTATIGSKPGDIIFLENVADAPLSKSGRGTIEVYPLPTF